MARRRRPIARWSGSEGQEVHPWTPRFGFQGLALGGVQPLWSIASDPVEVRKVETLAAASEPAVGAALVEAPLTVAKPFCASALTTALLAEPEAL